MVKEDVISIHLYIDTHTQNGLLLSHKKERNLAICDMDGPLGLYAKWNKSDRERQVL